MTFPTIRRARSPGLPLWAWLASGALHALLLVLAARLPSPVQGWFEPIRVVMVEPPPPPPGLPDGEAKPEAPPVPAAEPEPRERIVSKPKPVERAKPPEVGPTPALTGAPKERSSVSASASPPSPQGRPGGTEGGLEGGIPGGRGDPPVPAGRVARPPQILERVPPDYPRRARLDGLEGEVLLEAIVDRRGRIEESLVVLRSVPGLDAAALEAVRRWRFRPARDERGRAVRVIVEIPIRFVLR